MQGRVEAGFGSIVTAALDCYVGEGGRLSLGAVEAVKTCVSLKDGVIGGGDKVSRLSRWQDFLRSTRLKSGPERI